MTILKYIVLAVFCIISAALIVIATIQTKDSSGASATITGSSSGNFYEKNKGRTKEGKMKKGTIILGIAFMVMAVVTNVICVM